MFKFFISSVLLTLGTLSSAFSNDTPSYYEKADSIIPTYNIDLGRGFSFELKASIAIGIHGRGIGLNATTTYTGSAGSVSAGIGSTYYLSQIGSGNRGFETRLYGGGQANLGKGWSLGYYRTKFISGETSQVVANTIIGYQDWSFTFENDMSGDVGDRYRSHASILSYKDMSLGLNLFTGDPGKDKSTRRIMEDDGKYGTYLLASDGGDPDKYRLGAFYFRYKIFRLGTNSEYVRHWTQNVLIHDTVQSPRFIMRDKEWNLYGGVYTYNPFSAW